MEFKHGIPALIIAGSLIASPLFAQQRTIQRDAYTEGETDIAPSWQEKGHTSAGVTPEVNDPMADVPLDESEQVSDAFDGDASDQPYDEEFSAEGDRPALVEPEDEDVAELDQQGKFQSSQEAQMSQQDREAWQQDRQAWQQQQSSKSQQQGKTVVWGEDRQASGDNVVAVPPPLDDAFIRELQQALQQQQLYTGNVDGTWGPETHQALTKFQQNHGLQSDGQLDTQTLAALNLNQQGQQQQTQQQ